MDFSQVKDAIYDSRELSTIDWLVDVVVALGAFGFGLLQISISANVLFPQDYLRYFFGIHSAGPTDTAMFFVGLSCLPLIVRRKLPWPAFVLSVIFWLIGETEAGQGSLTMSMIGPLVALFTVAYQRSLIEGVTALAVMIVVGIIMPFVTEPSPLDSVLLLQNAVLVVAVFLGGYALQNRQGYILAAEARAADAEARRRSEAERAEAAERTRESEAQRRVEEERVRIAREIHDITAHSLSAVSIQAAAAERLVETDTSQAKEMIGAIRSTSKSALDEMRAIVNVLRTSGDSASDAATEPTQGTDHMTELQKYLQDAGISCTLDISGYNKAAIPAYIDMALFGIAREATTNIVRHSGASRARLTLSSNDVSAALIVEDDGCGISDEIVRGTQGHGIEGMRERVNVLGGKFEIFGVLKSFEGAGAGGSSAGTIGEGGGAGAGAGGSSTGTAIRVSVPLHNLEEK